MRRRHRILAAGILAILLSSLHARAQDKAYDILLDRPSKIGDEAPLELVYARNQMMKTTWNGAAPTTSDQTVGAHFIAETEILDVDERGSVTAEQAIVRTFTSLDEKSETLLLHPDQKILARVDGKKTRYEVDGKDASASLLVWLDQLLRLTPSHAVGADEICGSKTPRHVGETWPINAERAAASLKESDGNVDPKDISGTVHIISLETLNAEPCLKIEADVEVKHMSFILPTTAISEIRLKDSNLHCHYTWIAPLDVKKNVLQASRESTCNYAWTGHRGSRTYEVDQTVHTETDARLLDH